ncbi:MAG: sulfite exporter TauE/SafE family protein [Chloroflexota bacterium]
MEVGLAQLLVVGGIGLFAGVLSGLFGIGGGIVIVPLLVLVVGLTTTQAAGTSLAALLLPVGALGALEYWRGGFVDLGLAAVLAVGLLLGAYLGARLGISLPVEVVQRGFGVLLVIVGIRFIFFS